MIIEKPFRPTVNAGDGLAIDITADNQRHLANTMRHSDVVVNVASTMAIEAAIFDTPVVNISFDGETPIGVGAVGAPVLPVHALRQHHAARRRAGRRDAGRSWSRRSADISTIPSLDRDGRRRVVARAVSVSRRPHPPSASRPDAQCVGQSSADDALADRVLVHASCAESLASSR